MNMNMKKLIYTTLLSMSMLLSGCSSEKPEDIAVKYVKLLSEGNIEEAKKITDNNNDELRKIVDFCEKKKAQALVNEAIKISKTMSRKNSRRLIGKYLNIFQKEQDDAAKKYGSVYKIPSTELERIWHTIYMEASSGDEELAQIIAEIRKNDTYTAVEIAQNIIYKKTKKTSRYCAMPEIDKTYIIHTKISEEGDNANVRIEIIFSDGKAEKYDISLEKIQKEWKITSGILE